MFNNIGLPTPRGSGTNGYIQRSLATCPIKRSGPKDDLKIVKAKVRTRMDPSLLEHERRRAVEVQLLELIDKLKAEGCSEHDIKTKVEQERAIAIQRIEMERENVNVHQADAAKLDTHRQAELKYRQLERAAEAFGIKEDRHSVYDNGKSLTSRSGSYSATNSTSSRSRCSGRSSDPHATSRSSSAISGSSPRNCTRRKPGIVADGHGKNRHGRYGRGYSHRPKGYRTKNALRSRSRSPSIPRYYSRDRDRSGPRDRDRSGSRYRDRSGSRYRDRSGSRYRDRSGSRYRDRSGSRYRDRSGPRYRDRSGSRDRDRSEPRDRDRSGPRDREMSRSRKEYSKGYRSSKRSPSYESSRMSYDGSHSGRGSTSMSRSESRSSGSRALNGRR